MPNYADRLRIDLRFDHHPPRTAAVRETHELICAAHGDLARRILRHVPEGRERSLALRKLEEALMWSNAGIARHQDAIPDHRTRG